MSWLFSQAVLAASSAGNFLVGEPSAPLSVMPTAHPFSRRGKTMDASTPSPFGRTFEVLTASRGEELLTSYLAAFHVPTSAPQAKALESTAANQASGGTWRGSWAMYDPSSRSWRTPQCSLLADSAPFSETWPRWGSMRDGVCSALSRPASHTSANACGFSLPTPSGVNGGRNNMMGRVDEWGGSSNPLRGTVIGSMCLPEFEEMVMGWPIGWTAPTPYATAKYHEWRRQHSAPSTNNSWSETA